MTAAAAATDSWRIVSYTKVAEGLKWINILHPTMDIFRTHRGCCCFHARARISMH
jgi:hypothetical protein